MPKDQETRVLIGGRKFRKIPVLASVSVENESSDSLGRRSRSFSKKSYDTDTDGGHSGLRRRMTTAVTAVDESYFTPPNKIEYQQQMGDSGFGNHGTIGSNDTPDWYMRKSSSPDAGYSGLFTPVIEEISFFGKVKKVFSQSPPKNSRSFVDDDVSSRFSEQVLGGIVLFTILSCLACCLFITDGYYKSDSYYQSNGKYKSIKFAVEKRNVEEAGESAPNPFFLDNYEDLEYFMPLDDQVRKATEDVSDLLSETSRVKPTVQNVLEDKGGIVVMDLLNLQTSLPQFESSSLEKTEKIQQNLIIGRSDESEDELFKAKVEESKGIKSLQKTERFGDISMKKIHEKNSTNEEIEFLKIEKMKKNQAKWKRSRNTNPIFKPVRKNVSKVKVKPTVVFADGRTTEEKPKPDFLNNETSAPSLDYPDDPSFRSHMVVAEDELRREVENLDGMDYPEDPKFREVIRGQDETVEE